jgi:hypothetical protein
LTWAFCVLYPTVVSSQGPNTLVDPDSYAVYNALIPSDWLVRVAHASELLIQNTTQSDSPFLSGCVPRGPRLTGPWLEAMNVFRAQQTTAKSLDRQFSLPVPYRLESRETIQSFFNSRDPSWERLHATYPAAKGYLVVSAVGFDKAHEHAVVYLAHSCGGLCGEGGYHFLERAPDGWREVRLNARNCNWVS